VPVLPNYFRRVESSRLVRLTSLLDQALLHFEKGQGEEDETEDQEITDFPKQEWRELPEAERPCKIGEMGEREEEGNFLRPPGKIINGEEGSAEEKHRGDE
jgi:hypothetical protein